MDKSKKLILPLIAGILVVIALIVVIVIPRNSAVQDSSTAADDGSGTIVIKASDLSSDEVSLITVSDDSRIELLARLGDDGTAKVALGTCQSCNGSPGAYYTQNEDYLQCNNCGLTFPLEVVDAPGDGCHPITIDESVISYENGDAIIDLAALSQYEELFEHVTIH